MAPSIALAQMLPFVEATRETFLTLHQVRLSPRAVALPDIHQVEGGYSVVAGLTGTTAGICILTLAPALVERLHRPAAEPAKPLSPEGHNTAGALVRAIAGAAAAKLATTPYQFHPTPPAVFFGGPYTVFSRQGTRRVVVHFTSPEGDSVSLAVCMAAR